MIVSLLPLVAQQPAVAPVAAKPAESPVPSTESWITGSVDLGYRWRTDVAGSRDTYRSIVNLGAGPKLLGADFMLLDPKHRAFDSVNVRAYSWGGDPYSTFHLDAKKAKLYDFSADYRNIAYFNALPSYADPLLTRGIILNEQSFDTRRRYANFTLDMLPGNWLVPYLAYDRDAGSGTGSTVFVSDRNEYALPNRLNDRTNLYRGGVRVELRRFHATLEQGGTTFKDDESVYQAAGSTNFGNVATPVSGQRLDLTSFLAGYGIRGSSIYSKALFTSSATSWLDVYGQFLFSQPDSDVHYQQAATGIFYLQSQLLLYNGQQFLLSSTAKLPHTSASAGVEIRPLRRVRVMETWLTDRLHSAGSASSTDTLLGAALLASSLMANYSQQETNVFFDATSKLTLRGGYRYVWGDAAQAVLPAAGLSSADQGRLRRNVGIGAVTVRPFQKLSMTAEVEVASSSGAYFRTSLYDYQKVRAQGRYQATTSLRFAADFTRLTNDNPLAGARYGYRAQQASLSASWAPAAAKLWDFEASYSRSDLRSDTSYLAPQDLAPQISTYRDESHIVSALCNLTLPHSGGIAPRLTTGGSFFISSGNRATNYYQPMAKLWLPLGKHANWFTEWRYYGYGERIYQYEGFRSHLVTTGLRFTR